jgi:anti-sigma-K factor RskA
MIDTRHAQMVEHLEEYVLGQLSAADQQDVEAHLRTCADCAGAVRELTETMGTIGETVPRLEPPAALKQRVLASIANEPQELASGVTPFQARSTVVDAGLPGRRSAEREGGSRHVPASSRWLLAAAAIVVLGLGTALVQIESSRRSLDADVRRANATATELQERLRQYSGQTDLALSILTAGDMRELSLVGRENAVAAAARAYWSPTRGLLVVADRLPTPPPGRIYQVWIIESGKPMSAGLLGEPTSGRGMLIAPPPRAGALGTVTVAVTDEPPGGLTAPSGTIRLAGSL